MALWPIGGNNRFYEKVITNKIDLYGPWWIINTWMFLLMFASYGNMRIKVNFSSTLNSFLKIVFTGFTGFVDELKFISRNILVVYAFGWVMPVVIGFILKTASSDEKQKKPEEEKKPEKPEEEKAEEGADEKEEVMNIGKTKVDEKPAEPEI